MEFNQEIDRMTLIENYTRRAEWHIYNLCEVRSVLDLSDSLIALQQGLTALQYAELIVSAMFDIDINDSSRLAQRVGFIGIELAY